MVFFDHLEYSWVFRPEVVNQNTFSISMKNLQYSQLLTFQICPWKKILNINNSNFPTKNKTNWDKNMKCNCIQQLIEVQMEIVIKYINSWILSRLLFNVTFCNDSTIGPIFEKFFWFQITNIFHMWIAWEIVEECSEYVVIKNSSWVEFHLHFSPLFDLGNERKCSRSCQKEIIVVLRLPNISGRCNLTTKIYLDRSYKVVNFE